MDNTYTDDRGTIKDLLVTDDYSITHITFEPDAVRGNHYHEHTDQYDFILKGKVVVAAGNFGETLTLEKGQTIMIPRGQEHAYKALEYSEIISTCFGIRKGEDYEKDVVRLETPILK